MRKESVIVHLTQEQARMALRLIDYGVQAGECLENGYDRRVATNLRKRLEEATK